MAKQARIAIDLFDGVDARRRVVTFFTLASGPTVECGPYTVPARSGKWTDMYTGDVEPTRLKDSVRVAVTGDDERNVLVSG